MHGKGCNVNTGGHGALTERVTPNKDWKAVRELPKWTSGLSGRESVSANALSKSTAGSARTVQLMQSGLGKSSRWGQGGSVNHTGTFQPRN